MNEPQSIEQLPPSSGIMPFKIPAERLGDIESYVASSLGYEQVVVCRNSWVVNPEITPESAFAAALALLAIRRIADGLILSDPIYEGVLTGTFGNAPERPNALAFVSSTLSSSELETKRIEVANAVNEVLMSIQSPHRLRMA